MIEEKLQKQLQRSMFYAICIIVVILAGGGILAVYLQSEKNEAVRAQVILEAEEYKNRIRKQLETDFQILTTLSAFLEENVVADRELLAGRLDEANQNNTFLTMVYYDTSGEGVISVMGEEPVIGAKLSDLSPEGRRVIEFLFEGTASVSRLFESKLSDSRVFAYSVPVYGNDRIIGALAASDHIEIFSDILSGNTVLGGGGYIHMLNSEGDFLVRSSRTVIGEALGSIFDGSYLTGTSREEVRDAMENQERLFSEFDYEGKSYSFLLEPVGINGWYLLCVNTEDGVNSGFPSSATVIQLAFIGIVPLMIVLMLHGYRLLSNYNRSLISLAYYDPLTGCENLTRFRQRLMEVMGNTQGSVAAISIRQFPFLNEIFGKEKVIQLLCQIKEIAGRHLNQDEFFCRDTDDKFYLFLKETDQEVLRSRLEAFLYEIEHEAEISRSNYQLAIYCGVAVSGDFGNPDDVAGQLMNSVVFALERARGAHTSTIWFFDSELHKKEELENYIESHMHQALRDGEFQMYLQPKKNLRSGLLGGAEALVRWRTGEGRVIFPDQFIPIFERNGFCIELDLYMAEQACRWIRSWIDRGIPPIPISVNQSKRLFFKTDYVQVLTGLARKYEISPQLITLEILEGMALENVEELNAKIVRLQAEGFRISLDDFGSGYSSLNTLGKLKIDELKLDREFLMNASAQEQRRIRLIMEQIVRMAGRLGIATVAEGVEIPGDEELIRTIGCDYGQGYLYSRPISAADFDEKYMNGKVREQKL